MRWNNRAVTRRAASATCWRGWTGWARACPMTLAAHVSGGRVPRPSRLAFAAPDTLPPLRQLLLGMNAHINYDLPQALLAVISDADFTDSDVPERRRRDHERIDGILASRVRAENDKLAAQSTVQSLDRLLRPLNELSSKRFLREARRKVWHNTVELQHARLAGPDQYAVRLSELEVLSAARIADLLAHRSGDPAAGRGGVRSDPATGGLRMDGG